MAEKTRAQLESKFITGYVPTQGDFADVFDSTWVKLDDGPTISGSSGSSGANGSSGSSGVSGSSGSSGSSGVSGSSGSSGVSITGDQGDKGGLRYYFDISTSAGVRFHGSLRFDAAAFNAIANIYINVLDVNGINLNNYISTWGNSSSTVKGTLIIKENSNSLSTICIFSVLATSNNTTYYTLSVTPLSGSIPLNTDSLVVEFIPTGDQGNGNGIWSINAITSSTYDLVRNDAGKLLTFNTVSGTALSIPNTVTFTVGTSIKLMTLGNGVINITAASGVTLNCAGATIVNSLYKTGILTLVDTNSWVLEII